MEKELNRMFKLISRHPTVILFNYIIENSSKSYQISIKHIGQGERPFKVWVTVKFE